MHDDEKVFCPYCLSQKDYFEPETVLVSEIKELLDFECNECNKQYDLKRFKQHKKDGCTQEKR